MCSSDVRPVPPVPPHRRWSRTQLPICKHTVGGSFLYTQQAHRIHEEDTGGIHGNTRGFRRIHEDTREYTRIEGNTSECTPENAHVTASTTAANLNVCRTPGDYSGPNCLCGGKPRQGGRPVELLERLTQQKCGTLGTTESAEPVQFSWRGSPVYRQFYSVDSTASI